MKRGLFAFGVAVLLLVTGSACGGTPGDGNLTDDWAVMASASPRVPVADSCYAQLATTARQEQFPNLFRPFACTTSHGVELFHVGTLPSALTAPPAAASKEHWQTFDECEKQANTFLGGEWQSARLYLAAKVPTSNQWEGGARWYACLLMETKNVTTNEIVSRTGSLKNALAGVAFGCTTVQGLTADSWDDMTPVNCSQPHDAEYAGSYKVSATTFPDRAGRDNLDEQCWTIVAKYLNGTVSGMQVGFISWGLLRPDWDKGDRWVRCFAWSDSKKVVGSVKGIGDRTPPG